MKKRNYVRKEGIRSQLYTLTDEIKEKIAIEAERIKDMHEQDVNAINENYRSNAAMLTLQLKQYLESIRIRKNDIVNIDNEISKLQERILQRQEELSKDGKRDYIAERDDTILGNSKQLLFQYKKDRQKKELEMSSKIKSANDFIKNQEANNQAIMQEQKTSAEINRKKKTLLSRREISIKGIYGIYRDDIKKLDMSVEPERTKVSEVDHRLQEIETEFNTFKKAVTEKYEKVFEAEIAKKKQNKREWRKFNTKVYCIPENMIEDIIKNRSISAKDLDKLEKKSPRERFHDNLNLQKQSEINKKFDEYKDEIARLKKVKSENIPALDNVEAQKLELKDKLKKSIDQINSTTLAEARKQGVSIGESEMRKSKELFREAAANKGDATEDRIPKMSSKTTVDSNAKAKKAAKSEKAASTKNKKGLFGKIADIYRNWSDRRYEKKVRKQEECYEEERKRENATLLKFNSEFDSLSRMVTSQEELSRMDSELGRNTKKDKEKNINVR